MKRELILVSSWLDAPLGPLIVSSRRRRRREFSSHGQPFARAHFAARRGRDGGAPWTRRILVVPTGSRSRASLRCTVEDRRPPSPPRRAPRAEGPLFSFLSVPVTDSRSRAPTSPHQAVAALRLVLPPGTIFGGSVRESRRRHACVRGASHGCPFSPSRREAPRGGREHCAAVLAARTSPFDSHGQPSRSTAERPLVRPHLEVGLSFAAPSAS